MNRKDAVISFLSEAAATKERYFETEIGIYRHGSYFLRVNDDEFQIVCSYSHAIRHLFLGKNFKKDKYITDVGVLYFPQGKWHSLITLSFNNCPISDKACKYITRCNMPVLSSIMFSSINVGDSGVFHLTKANWENLKDIHLEQTKIRQMYIKWINKGKWPKMKQICMKQDHFRVYQVIYIFLFPFKDLKKIYTNFIRSAKFEKALKKKKIKMVKL